MFYQKEIPEEALKALKEESAKVIGENQAEHAKKIAWFNKKWDGSEDSEPMRVIGLTFKEPIAPYYHAVMADNIKYFQTHYKRNEGNANETLALACLCGSRKIAEFLLKDLKSDYLSKGNEYMLSYVAASQNTEWAKDIACIIAKAGKEMPQLATFYADDDDIVTLVTKIFDENKPKGNAKPGK